MKFDIIEVFTRAAKITWKYKVLWIFGILAGCGRSGGGNSNSGGSGNNSGSGDNPFSPQMMRQAQVFFERMQSWFLQNMWIIYVLFAVVFITIVLQIFFSLIGSAGLARGVVKAENGAETLAFGELFGESLDYLWRLLGAALVIWLPFIALFVLVILAGMIPAINSGADIDIMIGLTIWILLGLCCCGFPLSIVLNLYHFQVKRSIIVEDMGVFGALARGWLILSQNAVPLLIIGVTLGIAGFIIRIILSLPVILLILPLMQLFIEGNITSWAPFIGVGAFILCYSPILWLLSGILMTYTESVWTLAYLRIINPKESAPVFIEANA